LHWRNAEIANRYRNNIFKDRMNRKKLYGKTLAIGATLGLTLSQSAAFAVSFQHGDVGAASGDVTNGVIEGQKLASAAIPAAQPPVRVRATQEEGNPSVLSGSISQNVEILSKQVLQDEINLQKFNLALRVNAAKQGRWKGWRYFFSQEGNLGLTEAGIITTIAERGEHIHDDHAHLNSKNKLANGGTLLGAIGQIMAGFGSATELGINEYHAIQAQHQGYGSKEARNTALKLVADVDHKLAERERLIKEQPSSDQEIAELQEHEGKVLADFRDLAVAEFERYHTSAKKALAQQNSFYALDVGKNTAGVIGSFFIMHSILRGFRQYNIPGGVFNTVSGAMIALDPVISRLVAKAVERADKRNMEQHGLPTVWENKVKLEEDYGRLTQFCANHQVKDRPELARIVARLEAYDANHAYVTDEIQRNSRALRRGNRTAVQNMGTGFIVGSTKMANGILTIVPGAKYAHSSTHTNTLIFAGNVAYLPGVSWGLLDNIRIQTQREFQRANQQKSHELPNQIMKARLDQLNAVEKKI
jgi:hypothetical protein